MTPERLNKARQLFAEAVKLPESEWHAFLIQSCGCDRDLIADVEALLAQPNGTEAAIADVRIRASQRPTVTTTPAASGLDTPAFLPDQVLAGRYRIVKVIGKGGMGEVYEAEDKELRERVALKMIRSDIAAGEQALARFKREIQLARRVTHPNVCRIFDLVYHAELGQGDSDRGEKRTTFLTMELLKGETLSQRLRRSGRFKPDEALPLTGQMAAALTAAHKAGVVHRDFKSSNVILVPSKEYEGGLRAVVTDFGLARQSITSEDSLLTASHVDEIAGTPAYMAPEQVRGERVTPASDIYAFGVVLYELVTGTLPFTGDSPWAVAIKRLDEAPPSPRKYVPDLDLKFEATILRCLERNPADRFPTALDVVMAMGGESVPLAPSFMTRRRAATAAMAAVVLVGAVAGWREWANASRRLPPEAQAFYEEGVGDIAAGAYFAATKALEEAAKVAPRAVQVHARLAEAWVSLDMPEKAGEEMLLVRRQDLSRLSKADRLQIEAIDLSITREFAAAAAKYEELARAGANSADVAVDLGRAYENADRPDDAIRSYRRAAEGSEHNPAAWLRLGVLYNRQSSNGKSGEAFAQADRLYQLTSNLEGLTEVALQQGIAANTRGELDVGAAFLKKALDTARLAGNLQEEINATLRLSTNAYLSGDSAAADRYAREALDMARSHQLDAMAIRGLVNLGNAFRRKQDFARSEQYYRNALDLAHQTRSAHLTALSLLSLAGLHDETQQREGAVREAHDALTFYQANRYAKESLQCLTVMARAQRDGGDYDGALLSFRSLLQMAERSQDRSQLALAHEGIGSMLFKQDRYPEALEQYQKTLEFATDAEHVGYASLECGNTLWRLGQYREAAAMFARADASAKRFPPIRLQLMYGRAGMSLSQNRFQEAAEVARGALAADRARTPDLQTGLEEVLGLALLGLGNKSEGVRKCEAARAAVEARHDIDDTLQAGVAVLEARIEQSERKSALLVFHEMEPRLGAHPELLWRALALASRADAQYTLRAHEALLQLSPLWGDSAYNGYLTRPDVGKLVSALH